MHVRVFKIKPEFMLPAVFLLAALVMTIYEAIKEAVFKGTLTLWQSHTITILVTATIATAIAVWIRNWLMAVNALANAAETQQQKLLFEQKQNIAHQERVSYLRAILNNVADAIVTTDELGIIVNVNPAADKMFGYDSDEMLSKSIEVIVPEALSSEHGEYMQRYHYTGVSNILDQRREQALIRKDGSTFDSSIVVSSVRRNNGMMFVFLIRDISSSKRYELDLRESATAAHKALAELQHQKFALDQHSIVAVTDMQGRITYINDKFCNISGYSHGELIGQNHSIINSGHHPKGFFKEMYRTVANGLVWHDEVCNRAKDGSLYWVDTTITPYMGSDGKPKEYISIRTDITERKLNDVKLQQAQADLEKRNENLQETHATLEMQNEELLKTQTELVETRGRYIDLFEFAPVGYLSISNHGMITEINWKATALFGFSRKHLIQKRFAQFVADDDKARWQRQYSHMKEFAGGEELGFDLRLVHENGSVFHANLNCLRMDDEDDQPMLRITLVDVTQLKQAENARKRLELRLQATLNAIPDTIFNTGLNGRIYSFHSPSADLLLAPGEDIIGKRISEVMPADAAAVLMAALMEANENGHSRGKCFSLVRSHETLWFELYIARKTIMTGESRRFIVISRNITERKHAEDKLSIAATAFETQNGIIVTDADKAILRVNHAFTTITGYTEFEVIGKPLSILNSEPHHAEFYAEMWTIVSSTSIWEGEIWKQRKNGENYPEHLTVAAVKNSNGIVTNYVVTMTDNTERKLAENEINHLAFFDTLTQLPNRRLLVDRLNQALATSSRSGKHGALLFLNLDHFKTLNDSLGHDIGDMLLRQVAERLTSSVREGDTVARLGGDEYVIILEDLSEQSMEAATQSEIAGEKILNAINQPYLLGMHECHSTSSIGVTLFGDHEESLEDLLKHADIAMSQAKKDGRNTLRFFDPHMQSSITARVELERELRKALDKQQFHLYYQVQVDVSRRPLGAEALIRWLHPERGLVSPFHFIPLAEESGLILPIGQWVLETACAQLKAWEQHESTRKLTISVNVSAKQLHQADFVTKVQATVKNHAINPTLLKLELTESMLSYHIEQIIIAMIALQAIGVRFELDDFGTGYSSLQYLKQLPLYQLKIDQSFVRELATDFSDKAIVRTVIAMAQSLNLEVIAEGVETEEQRQLLLDKGCTHFQGYLFGRPVPIEQFEAALTSC